jgi:anti-anti-sigma factor
MSNFFRVTDAVAIRVVELTLPETLDVDEFDRLNESLLREFSDRQGRWILDMASVDYIGSAVLGMMVNIRQHVKGTSGQLILCGMSPRLLDIFKACAMERLFIIARTRQEAVLRFGGGA